MNLEHENLVRLLGYCLEQETSFLVYDFAIYKSLDHFIFGEVLLFEMHMFENFQISKNHFRTLD